jgi:hypothetical protein
MYYAIHARASKTWYPWKIQNKYFYSLYSYETFYTKALEYKESFTHIGFKQMTKSLENIQLFQNIQMFGQAVSINIWLFWFV